MMDAETVRSWLLTLAPYVGIAASIWLSLRNHTTLQETNATVTEVKREVVAVKHLTNGNISVIQKLADQRAEDREKLSFSAGKDQGRADVARETAARDKENG